MEEDLLQLVHRMQKLFPKQGNIQPQSAMLGRSVVLFDSMVHMSQEVWEFNQSAKENPWKETVSAGAGWLI